LLSESIFVSHCITHIEYYACIWTKKRWTRFIYIVQPTVKRFDLRRNVEYDLKRIISTSTVQRETRNRLDVYEVLLSRTNFRCSTHVREMTCSTEFAESSILKFCYPQMWIIHALFVDFRGAGPIRFSFKTNIAPEFRLKYETNDFSFYTNVPESVPARRYVIVL